MNIVIKYKIPMTDYQHFFPFELQTLIFHFLFKRTQAPERIWLVFQGWVEMH